MDTSGTSNYWHPHPQDANQSAKSSHLKVTLFPMETIFDFLSFSFKFPVNSQIPSQYGGGKY